MLLMMMITKQNQCRLLPKLLALLCCSYLLLSQQHQLVGANDEIELKKIADKELSDEELGSAIKDFGKQVTSSMASEMDRLLNDIQQSPSTNAKEFERFREVNEALSKSTRARIEQVGECANSGELTRGWATNLGQTFVSKANTQIQSASTFLDHQMTMLSGLAPKVRGQLRSIPGKLLRLMQWPTFLTFKLLYKKAYKSAREELYRQLVYLNNQAACGVQNIKFVLGKTSHLLKATQLADLSAAEYREAYNNPDADYEDVEALFTGGGGKLDAARRSQLEHLAKEQLNVFGKSIEKALERSVSKRGLVNTTEHQQRRRRRSVVITGNELDEDDSEDDEDEFEDALDHLTEEQIEEEAEALRLVDSYASEFFDGAKISMDDIDDIVDQALDEEHKSKPVDLRQTGCIIKPENQDVCGCCYAHVTTAAAAYYNCMQSEKQPPKPVRYNARFVSDCGRYLTAEGETPQLKGCTSGKVSMAVKFARLAGVHSFPSYEVARLHGVSGFGSDNCAWTRPESIENWAPLRVPFYEQSQFTILRQLDEVDLHLRTVGPVWLNIATWKDFHLQGPGIVEITDIDESQAMRHSMLIVGHDRDANGRDYFIVWNSHGIAWGEDGFVRIYSDALLHFRRFMSGLLPNQL